MSASLKRLGGKDVANLSAREEKHAKWVLSERVFLELSFGEKKVFNTIPDKAK
jgi:hypothetical protein